MAKFEATAFKLGERAGSPARARNAQKCHVDHSMIPRSKCQGEGHNMDQLSVDNCAPTKPTLNVNRHHGAFNGKAPYEEVRQKLATVQGASRQIVFITLLAVASSVCHRSQPSVSIIFCASSLTRNVRKSRASGSASGDSTTLMSRQIVRSGAMST